MLPPSGAQLDQAQLTNDTPAGARWDADIRRVDRGQRCQKRNRECIIVIAGMDRLRRSLKSD